jgi:hypothetical protein
MGRPKSKIQSTFPFIQTKLSLQKGKIRPSRSPKISKFCQEVDNFKGKIFPSRKKFKFQMDFELKIQETNQIQNLNGFKPFGKNPINLPNF